MNKVLFELTEDNLETGLRGIPVGYCPTSYVDPQKGLHYVGLSIFEIKDMEPQEVIYLLYTGKKGDKASLQAFERELKKRQAISKEAVSAIEKIPTKGTSMDMFCCALLILGMFEKTEDYKEDCLNLIAKLPYLVAIVINTYAGWGATKEPDENLGYMENFVRLVNVPNKDEKRLLEIFKLFNILHYDHGGGNLSCFTGKTVASGKRHLYGSISAAMNALAGPLHGRANQDGLQFIQEVSEELNGVYTEDVAEKLLRERLSGKKLIFGFGHAVLRVEDPRATLFYEYAEKHFSENDLVKTTLLLRTIGSKILAENPKISDPFPNVDAISGTALSVAGFSYPQFYTLLFGLSRSVGIAIQVLYEREYARGGKGTPIVRPRYIYRPRA